MLPVCILKVMCHSSSLVSVKTGHQRQQVYHCLGRAGNARFLRALQYIQVMFMVALDEVIARSNGISNQSEPSCKHLVSR